MMKPLILAAALALTACVPQTKAASNIEILGNNGGDFYIYREGIFDHWIAGGTYSVRGFCGSACTMILMMGPSVCTYPEATWAFHAASRNGVIEPSVTEDVRSYYPPGLQVWFGQNAAHLHGADYAQLSGAEMIDAGYVKECL